MKKKQLVAITRLAMRLTFVQIALSITLSCSLYAKNMAAQSILDKPVTISVDKVALQKIILQVQKQTGVKFIYSPEAINAKRVISCNIKDSKLIDFIDENLKPLGISYKVVDNQIVLFQTSNKKELGLLESIELKQTVYGTIVDNKGQPLAGATVTIKGTNSSTVSDANGKFSFDVAQPDAVLVVSFLGFKSQEIALIGRSEISITMELTENSLQEVVVVGYGTQKKRDITGSISSVSSKDIKAIPVPRIDQALQGRASGVLIAQGNGQPGGAPSIRVRGTGSINGGLEPQWVIDGVPSSPGSSLNPNDIESIEVLKDASATAIYGARGANGVILVTTKRGKSGKTKVAFDTYFGQQQITKTIPLLNAQQFAELQQEIATNDARPLNPLYANPSSRTTVNWQDEMFRKAPVNNYQLSISGGSDKSQFNLAGSYFKEDGIIKNSGFERFSLRSNIDSKISERIKVGLNLFSAYSTTDNVATGSNDNNPVFSALRFDPGLPIIDPTTGFYSVYQPPYGGNVNDNPVALVEGVLNESKGFRVLTNAFADLKILNGLTFRTNLAFDGNFSKNNFYRSRVTQTGRNIRGGASIDRNDFTSWLIENTLNYTKVFGTNHNFSALAGFTAQEGMSQSNGYGAQGFSNDILGVYAIPSGSPSTLDNVSTGSEFGLISYLGRLNYGFKNKYLFTFTMRADGSSRFGDNNKYGYFPSGAISYRLMEEPFMQGLDNVFDDIKIRGSYGLTGNQEIGNYTRFARIGAFSGTNVTRNFQYGFGTGAPVPGFALKSLENNNLRWEKTAQTDVGIDLSILNSRINITADYYLKKTTDLLLNVPVIGSLGLGPEDSSILENVGAVKNRGFEFNLSTKNIDGAFSWNTAFNISTNKATVVNLGARNNLLSGPAVFGENITTILSNGGNISAFYGYRTNGIWQTTDNIAGGPQPLAKPGDIRYVDLDGNNVINGNDREVLGSGTPQLFGGFNNEFNFKGFDLSVFFDFAAKYQIVNYNKLALEFPNGDFNQTTEVLNRWTPTNPSNTVPRATSRPGTLFRISDRIIENGDYIRLRNISLGYTLPAGLLKSIGSSRARVYVSGQNIATITKYSGFNPQVSTFGGSTGVGFDNGTFPLAKSFLIGLNVEF